MSDPTAQEPTMEEILASIRRIISEDDAPAETAAAPAPAPEPAPAPAPVAAPEPASFGSAAMMDAAPSVQEPEAVEEDILELTDTYEAPAVESIGDLDVSSPEPEAPTAWTAPVEPETASYDSLVGESAAASAASAFAGLHASLKQPSAAPAPVGDLNFISGSTVEGMVAEMLKPMLKSWLDTNLPGIVERAVKAEVERISSTAG
jgi:cell pole-organizing protein PopZ